MKEITFGLIAVAPSKEDPEMTEVLHFIGYETKPDLTDEFLNDLYMELLQENVFTLERQADLAICPDDLLEEYKKVYQEFVNNENQPETTPED